MIYKIIINGNVSLSTDIAECALSYKDGAIKAFQLMGIDYLTTTATEYDNMGGLPARKIINITTTGAVE